MTEAWLLADIPEGGDQRLEHRLSPNVPVTAQELERLNILSRNIPNEADLEALCKERQYVNHDEMKCADLSVEMRDTFFTEHIHEDEEVRYILDGEGYFDVRDLQDRWVRVKVTKYDLLIVPAGIYHRFTVTSSDFCHARRVFQDAPRWVAINRPAADMNPHHLTHIRSLLTAPPPPHAPILHAEGGESSAAVATRRYAALDVDASAVAQLPRHVGVVFVTGASTGIGLCSAAVIARRFPAATIVCTMRNPTAAREQQVRDVVKVVSKERLVIRECDVSSDASVEACVASVTKDFGGVDVALLNAGYGVFGSMETVEMSAVRAMFETNYWGVLRCTRALLPGMCRRPRDGQSALVPPEAGRAAAGRGGLIVAMSSLAGVRGLPTGGHYAATKFALEGLFESDCAMYGRLGVQLSLLEPGPVGTPFFDKAAVESTADAASSTKPRKAPATLPHAAALDALVECASTWTERVKFQPVEEVTELVGDMATAYASGATVPLRLQTSPGVRTAVGWKLTEEAMDGRALMAAHAQALSSVSLDLQ